MASLFSTTSQIAAVNTRIRSGVLTLPLTSANLYRQIMIKDLYGAFPASTLTLSTQLGDTFEDGTTTRILCNAYEFQALYAGSTSRWHTVAGTQWTSMYVSSLRVDSLQLGSGDGWADFGPLRATAISSLQIYTGYLQTTSISTLGLSTGTLTACNISAVTMSTNYGFFSTISTGTVYGRHIGDGSLLTGLPAGGLTIIPPFLSTTTLSTNLLTASNISTNSISTNNLTVSNLYGNGIAFLLGLSVNTISTNQVNSASISNSGVISTLGLNVGSLSSINISTLNLAAGFISTLTLGARTAYITNLFVGTEDFGSALTASSNITQTGGTTTLTGLSVNTISTNFVVTCNISTNSISTNFGFFSTISANTIYGKHVGDGSLLTGITGSGGAGVTSTLSTLVFLTSSISTANITSQQGYISSLTVDYLAIGSNYGYVNMGDVIATSLSSIAIETQTITTGNLKVGVVSSLSYIAFPGLQQGYTQGIIAEQSTGTGLQELLIFRGSSASDRIRMQTTGSIVFEPGVGARIFPSAPSNATPAMIINTSSNVGIGIAAPTTTLDVAGTGRFQMLSTQQIFVSSISSGSIFGRHIGDGSLLTGLPAGGLSALPPFLSTTTLSTNLLTASNISTNSISTNNLTVSNLFGNGIAVLLGLSVNTISTNVILANNISANTISTNIVNAGYLVGLLPGNTATTSVSPLAVGNGNGYLSFSPQIEFQYYSGGGYKHFMGSRHNGSATNSFGNAIDFWLYSATTGANASTTPGTCNVNTMSVTAAGVGIFNNSPSLALDVAGGGRFTAVSTNIISTNTILANNISTGSLAAYEGFFSTFGTELGFSQEAYFSTIFTENLYASQIYGQYGGVIGINSAVYYQGNGIDMGSGNINQVGTYYNSVADINITAAGYNILLNATTAAKSITLTSPYINIDGVTTHSNDVYMTNHVIADLYGIIGTLTGSTRNLRLYSYDTIAATTSQVIISASGYTTSANIAILSFQTQGAGGGTVEQRISSRYEGGYYGLSIDDIQGGVCNVIRVANGSVGILCNSPSLALDVNGAGKFTAISTNIISTNSIYAGSVGVLCNSPGYTLDVNGTINASGTVTVAAAGVNQGLLRLTATGGATYIQTGLTAGANNFSTNLYFTGMNGAPNLMTLTANGNLGIGTTSPTYPLQVVGAGCFTAISTTTISTNTITTSNIRVGTISTNSFVSYPGLAQQYTQSILAEQGTGAGLQEMLIFRGSSASDRIRLQTTGYIVFETGVGARVYPTITSNVTPSWMIDINGCVGVGIIPSGTTNKLDVAGQGRFQTLSTTSIMAGSMNLSVAFV